MRITPKKVKLIENLVIGEKFQDSFKKNLIVIDSTNPVKTLLLKTR